MANEVATLSALMEFEDRMTAGLNQATGNLQRSMRTIESETNRAANSLEKLQRFAGQTLKAAFAIGLGTAVIRGASNIRKLGKEAVLGAGRVAQMDEVLRTIGRSAGWTADQIDEQVQSIRAAGIEYGVAQRVLQDFIRYQLDVTQATDLARVAQNAAVLSNSNSSETLDRLIYGITTQNSLILRNAGLQVQAGKAMSEYALQLGKAQDSLSGAERVQAVFNAVLAEGAKITGAYEVSMRNPIKQLGSLKRLQDDVSNNLGKTFFPVLKVTVNEGLTPFWKAMARATEEGSALNDALSKLGDDIANVLSDLISLGQNQAGDALRDIGEALVSIGESAGVFREVLLETDLIVNSLTVLANVMAVAARVASQFSEVLQAIVLLKLAQRYLLWERAQLAFLAVTETTTKALGLQTAGAGLLTVAHNRLATAFKAVGKAAIVYASFKVVTAALDAFTRKSFDAVAAANRFSEALGEGELSAESYADAVEQMVADVDNALNQYLANDWVDQFDRNIAAAIPGAGAVARWWNPEAFTTLQDQINELAEATGKYDWEVNRLIESVILGNITFTEFWNTLASGPDGIIDVQAVDDAEIHIHDLRAAIEAMQAAMSLGSAERFMSILESGGPGLLNAPETQGIIKDLIPDFYPYEGLRAPPEYKDTFTELNRLLLEQAQNGEIDAAALQTATIALSQFNTEQIRAADLVARAEEMREAQIKAIMKATEVTYDEAASILGLQEKQASAAETAKVYNDVLTATTKPMTSFIKGLDIVNGQLDDIDGILAQTVDGTLSLEDAQAALVQRLPNYIDQTHQLAAAAYERAQSLGEELTMEQAFADELDAMVDRLVGLAEQYGVHTDAILAMTSALTDLDGTTARAFMEFQVQFGMDVAQIEAALAFTKGLAAMGRLPGSEDQIAALEALLAVAQIFDAAAAQRGPDAARARGGGRTGGGAAEPTYGGLTADEWRAIADEQERIANLASEQAGAFQQGVSIIVGAFRAQKNLNDLQQASIDLQEERAELVGGGIAQQEELVAALEAEARAITATEQVAIESAQNSVRAAERRYRAGIISAAELQAAREALTKAEEDAVALTPEAEQAQADLVAMKERVDEIDKQLIENAWAQVEAQAALASAVAEVAANAELVAEALGNIDFTNIPGADDFLAGLEDLTKAGAALNVSSYVGLTRGQAMVQIAKQLGYGQLSQEEAFKALQAQGIFGYGGSAANFGGTFTAEQAALVQDRIQNNNSITIYAGAGTDPLALGEAVVAALEAYMDVNGTIPIVVESVS